MNVELEISSQGDFMNSKNATNKMAKQLGAVRQKRIAELQKRITSGKYKVSNMEIAKALFLAR